MPRLRKGAVWAASAVGSIASVVHAPDGADADGAAADDGADDGGADVDGGIAADGPDVVQVARRRGDDECGRGRPLPASRVEARDAHLRSY